MTFRFTLTDPIGNNKIISEPGGWDTASIGLIRHPQFLSLVEYFKSSFQTYGSNGSEDGGRDWILSVEKTYGPDALIGVLVEIDSNDTGIFRTAFKGNLGVGLFIETLDQDHLLQIVFANSDFWSKFIARYQTQVDLRSTIDLDGNAVSPTPKFTLPLPSQKIIKKYSGSRDRNIVFNTPGPPGTQFILLVGFDNEPLNEITQKSSITFDISASDVGAGAVSPQDKSVPFFNFDDDGILDITKLKFTLSEGYPVDDPAYNAFGFTHTKSTKLKSMSFGTSIDFYLQKNNEAPIIFAKSDRTVASSLIRNVDGITIDNANTTVTDFIFTPQTLVIKKGDFIRIFGIKTDPDNYVWLWGKSGWSHDNVRDSLIYSQGSIDGAGGAALNEGHISFGGYFDASLNLFPATIDNDAGTGQPIQSGNQWLIIRAGVLGGVPVTTANVITAKVNTPGNVLANWDIGTLAYYENLEAYGMADTGFDCTFNTTAQDSTTEAFLTHDVAAGIIDRITGQTGLFYSEYLGNQWTSRVYGATGCGSLKANMLGLHVRGYDLTTKPMAPSMQDWFEGANPIDCLGLGYEKLADVDVIRCEQAGYFFDDSSMSILFSNVQTIKRSYDPNHQFNSIDYGYNKWQSQAASGVGSPSGIDDPQSQGTRNTLFKIIGKKFKIMSSWLGASRSIETMRRISILLSANYTYDNDIVVIKLHSNGDGTFRPELNENFSSITNLTNPDACYNVDLSSTRNFIRWLPYLSGCLQSYLSSFFKFATGQGNFTMISTKTTACPGDETGAPIAENGDIPIGTEFLFLPMPFEIDHYMDFDDYETLVANKNKAIGISQTESGHKPFFIDDTSGLDYNIATGLVHLKAWSKEAFDIATPETFSSIISTGSIPVTGHFFEEPYFETEFE